MSFIVILYACITTTHVTDISYSKESEIVTGIEIGIGIVLVIAIHSNSNKTKKNIKITKQHSKL